MWKFRKSDKDIDVQKEFNIYANYLKMDECELIEYKGNKKKILFFCIVMICLVVFGISLLTVRLLEIKKEIDRKARCSVQIENYINRNKELQVMLEKENAYRVPELTEQGKNNLKNIYNTEKKKAYLTFDDGPSINTSAILDVLKEKNVKATFFVLGIQVQQFPETLNRIYNEGHFIANHGYSHKYSEIYSSPEAVLNEFNKCNELVAQTLNVPQYNSHLFRFPGGYTGGKYAGIKEIASQLLEQNNILHIDWNSLTGDSELMNPTEEYLMNNLKQTTQDKNSIIVLMHDAHMKKITADTLPQVIDYIREQGYEFESFYKIIR